jgi:uroporphyrinogen-III synthase
VRLLVTRPEPAGERTAAKLRARGCEVLVAPLLRFEAIADAEFGDAPWAGLVVTSANAARAVQGHRHLARLRALKVFAVGPRTAAAMSAAGFGLVVSADGDQRDLLRVIRASDHGRAPLLYLAGEDRSGDLAGELAGHGLAVHTVAVYRAAAATGFPPAVLAGLAAGLDGVLHFSRRSATVYLVCAKAAGVLDMALKPFHYCLSRQVAEPLTAAGAARIRLAPRPEQAALIDLVFSP